ATAAGPHPVPADHDGAMAPASLTVTAGPVTTLTLSPTPPPIPAGGSQTYAAEGFDTYGNDAGDVTSSTTFTIDDPHGSCTGADCTGTTAGPHTATGTDGGATG